MKNGFGSLSKKDTELLIFACLDHALASNKIVKNMQWAQFLKLTPVRIKALRLESHMRHAEDFNIDGPFPIKERFLNSVTSIAIDLDPNNPALSGKIRLLLEDPVINLYVVEEIKNFGGVPEYERNREVLVIDLVSFLKLTSMVTGTNEVDRIEELAAKLIQQKKAQDTAKKEISKAAYQQLGEMDKLKKGVRAVLEAVAGQKLQLFDHMGLIFSSQKHAQLNKK